MLQNFLDTLRASASNDREPEATAQTRRRHPRREVDQCVAVIHGQTFPVENWSMGGLLLTGDERLFGVASDIDLTIKFKLRNAILDIPHKARVIRKNPFKIALEFAPAGRHIRRMFQQVVDDALAREFANSQI